MDPEMALKVRKSAFRSPLTKALFFTETLGALSSVFAFSACFGMHRIILTRDWLEQTLTRGRPVVYAN